MHWCLSSRPICLYLRVSGRARGLSCNGDMFIWRHFTSWREFTPAWRAEVPPGCTLWCEHKWEKLFSRFGRKMLCIISLWAQSWAWLQSPGSVGCARCAAWADCDINHYRNADVVYNLLQRHEARMWDTGAGLSGNNIRSVSIPEKRLDQWSEPALLHPLHSPLDSHNLPGQPLIHCRKLSSVLALSVSGKTFWATEEKLQLFSKKLLFTVKQCEALPGGWMIHCQRRHHTNITLASSKLESIYNPPRKSETRSKVQSGAFSPLGRVSGFRVGF